ncbi:HAD domain-containing protein [Actinocatenispora thailandica]
MPRAACGHADDRPLLWPARTDVAILPCVADRMNRPLLFLDVDGTLLPVGGDAPESDWDESWQNASNPLLARLSPKHGPRLLALPCELVWATAWMADANDVIAPVLGLPELPVAQLSEVPDADDPSWALSSAGGSLGWKTRALVEQAAGRPFVWLDDEINDADRAWVGAHHAGVALLHRVDARHGLTERDFTAVTDWLRDLSARP